MQSTGSAPTKLSPDAKEMMKILQRQHDADEYDPEDECYDDEEPLDSDDEGETSDLASRLEGIDLNNADAIWDKLTASERLEFEGIIKSGDVTNVVPIFIPWWEPPPPPKIQEIDSNVAEPDWTIPKICKQIDDFRKISSKPAADCVPHNLCNILAAYTFVVRFYNGDHMMNPRECCTLLISICNNLNVNGNFDDTLMAIESVAMECRNRGITIGDEETNLMKDDVGKLCKGHDGNVKDFTLAALSDMLVLLRAAKKCEPTTNKSADDAGSFSKRFPEFVATDLPDKTKLNSCLKKVQYYLAFVNQ